MVKADMWERCEVSDEEAKARHSPDLIRQALLLSLMGEAIDWLPDDTIEVRAWRDPARMVTVFEYRRGESPPP